ncbi:carbon monoxide dehydrogenase subunit G [Deinococcus geothermalis DSM 11300]|uniref:Carbon monoxide dehydrogenase subunit G n=1 Tax=Deinococcus geothermalis (strain DSM 11300 / CIP 105573 / AG-3a) TaxID=319795 RepID=Q1J1W8_DEIGD|nr:MULTISPECIES: carbon monoxide dehydrogenase subunit G [Deinococcus]ABF44516.1 carbon monoxide dehydrogenase subunit G [Deinococcus geothermalis DSM 11300]MBI0445719.1 carbon monoxide dehydrogenase [Deinococcus sp. DB0503]TDE86359.1 carbon monoxide dehydrogenase [Deinococcus sp. S9]
MKLSYSGQEQVQAPPAAVWAFVQDPERVARCLPDVQQVVVHDPTHLEATVQVGVGMVRGKFKFKIEVQPDTAANRVNVKVQGGGLGSVVDLTASANVVDNGDGTTTLDWTGDATMRGPVATVGGRVLDAQAQKLIRQTFQNLSAQVEARADTLA